ncbi:hypothetical protein MsedE_1070 [Metallosphaera sedula]|uniref:Uncharacterized protein n=1 Tax=Metallosphaera sedula TaxID=43687 RepID=A0A0K1T7R1_9CREN|nr:hypothetical protein MsedE_1070 [Metallosphaera sedula]
MVDLVSPMNRCSIWMTAMQSIQNWSSVIFQDVNQGSCEIHFRKIRDMFKTKQKINGIHMLVL